MPPVPPSREFQYDVLLSHSAKDEAVVRRLAERLRADGLKVWFDEWVLKPGDSIPARSDPPSLGSDGGTRDGLEYSRVLARPAVAAEQRWMFCMSAQAFGSDWAQLLPDSQPSTLNPQPPCAPLNQERRFILLRLADAPSRAALLQFLYINSESE